MQNHNSKESHEDASKPDTELLKGLQYKQQLSQGSRFYHSGQVKDPLQFRMTQIDSK
jgi:hypothetical protein